MNAAELILLIIWLLFVAASFWAAYSGTKKIIPRSRFHVKALFKAACRAFPWAFLLSPSFALGAIPIPAPAGFLIVAAVAEAMSGRRPLQGPNTGTGPLACMALALFWFLFFIVTLIRLRTHLPQNEKPA